MSRATLKERAAIIRTLKYDFLGLLAVGACFSEEGFASMRNSIDRMMREYEEDMRAWRDRRNPPTP